MKICSQSLIVAATLAIAAGVACAASISLITSPKGQNRVALTVEQDDPTFDALDVNTVGGVAILANGSISCPGSGTNSQRFGPGSTANGAGSTSLGVNSQANSDTSVAVGGAAQANGLSSTACGEQAQANNASTTAYGYLAQTNMSGGMSLGAGSKCNGSGGSNCATFGTNSTINSNISGTFLFAYDGMATKSHEYVFGSASAPATDVWIGAGEADSSTITTATLHSTAALVLSPAAGQHAGFANRDVAAGGKVSVLSGPAVICQLDASSDAGCHIHYHLAATDGVTKQVSEGWVGVVWNGATATVALQDEVNSAPGSLVVTPSATVSNGFVAVSIGATTTLTATSETVGFHVFSDSGSSVDVN